VKSNAILAGLAALIVAGAVPLAAQTPSGDFYAGGYPSAPVRLEVFSDYQCPACREYFLETVRKVLDDYSRLNKVAVIYHDFPLEAHQFSRLAARYSIAAQQLGREPWRALTEGLYREQPKWAFDGQVDLVAMKSLSPADYKRLKEKLKAPAIEQALQKAIALGNARQVESTPTSFLTIAGRTQRFVGGVPYQLLRDYIDRVLGSSANQ
jgi:protein-disulfide isomerase